MQKRMIRWIAAGMVALAMGAAKVFATGRNKALLDKLNAGLAAVKADGSYAAAYKKWFQHDAPALPAQ